MSEGTDDTVEAGWQELEESEQEQSVEQKKNSSQRLSNKSRQQLNFWPDDVRAMPNDLARSSLFNVRKNSIERTFIENKPLVTLGTTQITYTGHELRQEDQAVWMELCKVAKHTPLGNWCSFVRKQMLEDLKWGTSGGKTASPYKRLEASVRRLKATAIHIQSPRIKEYLSGARDWDEGFIDDEDPSKETGGIVVSLIDKLEHSGGTWRFKIDPAVMSLFVNDYYGYIEPDIYQQTTLLGKWLYSQYSSHKVPWPIPIDTLHEMSASTGTIKAFKNSLRKACASLSEEALGDRRVFESWAFTKGKDIVGFDNVSFKDRTTYLVIIKADTQLLLSDRATS